MLEVAGGIVLAVLILVFLGGMNPFSAALFGAFLVPVAAALVFYLSFGITETAVGIVVAAVVLASILREAKQDREEGRS